MAGSAYGELVSFGALTFAAKRGYINDLQNKVNAQDAYLAGSGWPVDLYAGGPAPMATVVTFTYWIVAPDGTAEADCAPYVDAAYATIEAALNTVATLTIKNAAGASHTVTARLLDCSVRESTREYSSMQLNLAFIRYGAWS